MALSTDVISQFVKMTNDTDKRSKSSTVWGTVVKNDDGALRVLLDGSAQTIPVETTAEYLEGDRVSVTIKDHIAIATGNKTHPSTNESNVNTTISNAVAENGIIDEAIKKKAAEIDEAIENKKTEIEETIGETYVSKEDIISDISAKKEDFAELVASSDVLGAETSKGAILAAIESKKEDFSNLVSGTDAFTSLGNTYVKNDLSNVDDDQFNAKVSGTSAITSLGNTYVKNDLSNVDDDQFNVKVNSYLTDTENGVSNIDTLVSEAISVGSLSASAVMTNVLEADAAAIGSLVAETIAADSAIVNSLKAESVMTDVLQANVGVIDRLLAEDITAESAIVDKLGAHYADINLANIDTANIDVANINAALVKTLAAESITSDEIFSKKLFANQAFIDALDTNRLNSNLVTTTDLEAEHAYIDFAEINMANINKLYTQSGIIEELVSSDASVTNRLVGVTINGDLIEGNTIVADKLVVKGDDGLYYKLNMLGVNADAGSLTYTKTDTTIDAVSDGILVEDAYTEDGLQVYVYGDTKNKQYYTVVDGQYYNVEASSSGVSVTQTDRNSLNGSVITTKSITATKIDVDDLVAFDATIGGFTLSSNAIHSHVKNSENNTLRGIYLDSSGQVNIGDGDNYIRYIRHEEYTRDESIDEPADVMIMNNMITTEGDQLYIKRDSYEEGSSSKSEVYYYTDGEDAKYYTITNDGIYVVTKLDVFIEVAGVLSDTDLADLTVEELTGAITNNNNQVYHYIRNGEEHYCYMNTSTGKYTNVKHQYFYGKTDYSMLPISGTKMTDQLTDGAVTYYAKSATENWFTVNRKDTYRLSISAESIEFALNDGKKSLEDLRDIGNYVHITEYKNDDGVSEPCIELGSENSAFKLLITNRRILFKDNAAYPAYITNEELHINAAVVEDRLQFGQFVWRERTNGNMGIVWVDEEVAE